MEPATLFLLITVGILCFVTLKRRYYKTAQTNIPGPKGWPIIGNGNYFVGVKTYGDAMKVINTITASCDAPMSRAWLGPKLLIIVKDPKYMEPLLNHRALVNKDRFFYQPFQDAAGHGLFTRSISEGWPKMRKPLVWSLAPKNISNFKGIIHEKIEDILIPELDKHLDEEEFSLSDYIKLTTMETFLMATLGLESLDEVEKDKYKLVHGIDRELEKIFTSYGSFGKGLGLKPYSPEECRRNLGYFPCKVMDVMRTRLEHEPLDCTTRKPVNYADVLFRFGQELNMTETETGLLLSDVIVAGTDTSSICTITLLLHLAINQECQEKIVQELVVIFGDSTRDPDEEDLKRMVYLEMCIKEILRLTCPPAVARFAKEDIEIDGYVIPRGAGLMFNIGMVQKDPRFWERPEEFYPERFLPEAVAMRPKGAFLPFASGPKMCPGMRYGYQIMKTTVSTLLRRYHWTTDLKFHEVEYKYLLLREPIKPFVKVTRRIWPTEVIANNDNNNNNNNNVISEQNKTNKRRRKK